MSLYTYVPISLSPNLLSILLASSASRSDSLILSLHISIYLKSDNGVSLSGIDTIDVIDSIDAIDEKNGRKGRKILY